MTYGEAIYQLTNFEGTYETPSLEAIELAIETLEKQIPKGPNVVCTSENLDLYDCYCPSCRLFLGSNISKEYGKLFKHHCECGQVIDWGE